MTLWSNALPPDHQDWQRELRISDVEVVCLRMGEDLIRQKLLGTCLPLITPGSGLKADYVKLSKNKYKISPPILLYSAYLE